MVCRLAAGNKLKPREVMLLQKVPNRRNCAMGIQSKEGYQSVSDWTASYGRFMDRTIVEPIELTNPLAHSQYARKRKGINYTP